MRRVLEIGVQRSSGRDLDDLLEETLARVMELARCDAGTLYLRDGDAPRFKISRNGTLEQRTYLNQGTACPGSPAWNMRYCLRKGALPLEERKIMENHVVVTDKQLSQIKFSHELSHVRQWAASHHEKLNGKGLFWTSSTRWWPMTGPTKRRRLQRRPSKF